MKYLILTPTRLESDMLERHLAGSVLSESCQFERCGFGPIAAAARTALLIRGLAPQHVVLAGIAGTMSGSVAVGNAYVFDEVVCYGIGAGTGSDFVTAQSMGWNQWSDSNSAAAADQADGDLTIGDVIHLRPANQTISEGVDSQAVGQLLTCCAASGSVEDVRLRLREYPHAVAEDMEGFAVAAACQLTATPLRIVRGISNRAGDRDKSNWQMESALRAAADIVLDLIR